MFQIVLECSMFRFYQRPFRSLFKIVYFSFAKKKFLQKDINRKKGMVHFMDWNKYIPFHSCFRVTRNWLPGWCKNYFLTFTISRTDSHRLLKTCILAKINSTCTSVSTPENFKDLVVMFCMLVTLREWCDGSWGASAFVCAANPRQ